MGADSSFDNNEKLRSDEEPAAYQVEFLQKYNAQKRRNILSFIIVILLLIVAVFVSFMLGRYAVTPLNVCKILLSRLISFSNVTWTATEETVVFSIRLPRILAALAVGASLALAGATYQGLFRNAMVSPDILGASSGASVGACVMMLFNFTGLAVQGAAFVTGLLAVTLSYSLSRSIGKGRNMTLLLVLCGMTVNTLCQAIVSTVKYLADTDDQLPEITYWLMGSIAKVQYNDLLLFLIPFLLGAIPLFFLRWQLNLLSVGEEEAKAMGVNVPLIRGICIICSTLLTAAVVSIAGTIGWVGLMIPHLVRFIVGPNNRKLLPMSMLVGALFMLIVDNFCRTLLAYEIPLGILTSLIGAPFFVIILYKYNMKEDA